MPVFYPSPHIAILFYCLNFHLRTALQILLNTCVRPLVLVIQFSQMFLMSKVLAFSIINCSRTSGSRADYYKIVIIQLL